MNVDEYYTSVCSAVTLQSNKKGFFQNFADNVIEVAGGKWLEEFHQLSSDTDRLLKCCSISEIEGVLHNVLPLFRGKAAKLSQLRRLEGEKATKEGSLEKALLLLTQSVVRAPAPGVDLTVDNGLSLSLSLWSRAQVLWQLSEFQLCLADVQQAIKEKLQNELRVEAYWLMSQCYQRLGEITRAKVSLQVTLKMLDSTNNADWKTKVDSELLKLTTMNNTPNTKTTEEDSQTTEELLFGEHPKLPGLSSVLAMSSNEKSGRYVVACHQVKSGDVLVSEKPYTSCLMSEKFGSHCHHCFKRLRVAVACAQCAGVAFCSVGCRDSAMIYHNYECQYMDLIIGSGMSILCHIALRTVTQQDYAYWRKVFNKQPVTPDYSRLAGLVTHADKRQAKDFVNRTLMALFLLRILEHSQYIPVSDCKEENKSGMQLFLGSVLLHLLQCLQFNAHEIYETVYKAELEFKKSKINYIGVGVYPSAAMLNHDCYPATARYFRGKELVLCAIRPINSGGMVTENYGPVFTLKSKEERIHNLAGRYWFTCECTACIEHWPKQKEIDESIINIRCKTKGCCGFTTTKIDSKKVKVKCTKCGGIINLVEALLLVKSYDEDLEQGLALMSAGKIKEAVMKLTSYSDVMHTVCRPPNRRVNMAHETLRTCFAYTHSKYIVQ